MDRDPGAARSVTGGGGRAALADEQVRARTERLPAQADLVPGSASSSDRAGFPARRASDADGCSDAAGGLRGRGGEGRAQARRAGLRLVDPEGLAADPDPAPGA